MPALGYRISLADNALLQCCSRKECRARCPARAVSAKDVATLAGVSRAAVSRSFTPGASVAPATRAKVFAAAERLAIRSTTWRAA